MNMRMRERRASIWLVKRLGNIEAGVDGAGELSHAKVTYRSDADIERFVFQV